MRTLASQNGGGGAPKRCINGFPTDDFNSSEKRTSGELGLPMNEKPLESWRARAAVSEALDVFNSNYMQEVWAKALSRRETDPEGAVTSARALLESVCKHILDAADSEFREGTPLPRLYEQTAKVLEMAPNEHLAPVFNSIFTACAEVIESIGRLRNELSDSHGRGPFGEMPHWRHAELAVNLSGAMATYLAAVWKGRQPTVYNVVHAFLASRPETSSKSLIYPLERMARDMDDVPAAKLRASDLVTYFERRAGVNQINPFTAQKEFALLRTALSGHSSEAFATAAEILRQRKLLPSAGGHVTPVRRVSQEDFEAIKRYLQDRAGVAKERKHTGTAIGTVDVAEFASWSGRKLIDILKLRWADVDHEKRTCKLPGDKKPFPLLERAWEMIEERRQNPAEPNGRIFPYDKEQLTQRHMVAVRRLLAEGTIRGSIRFQDYRHEAAHRLLEKGHSASIVARATGLPPGRILRIAEEVQAERGSRQS